MPDIKGNNIKGNLFIGRSENVLVQFFRYAIVGGVASLADILVFYFIANIIEWNHILANTSSFIIGLLVNYFMSRNWVFNKKENNFVKDFTLFAIVGVLGLLLSNVILYLLIDKRIIYKLLYALNLNEDMIKLSAKLIAVFVVLFWNFIGRKLVIGGMYRRK